MAPQFQITEIPKNTYQLGKYDDGSISAGQSNQVINHSVRRGGKVRNYAEYATETTANGSSVERKSKANRVGRSSRNSSFSSTINNVKRHG